MNVSTIDVLQAQNAKLREQIEERDELILQLKGLLVSEAPLPGWLPKLTPLEEQTLRVLIRRPMLTSEAFQHLRGADSIADDNTMKVHVFRIRRKLKPHGISIENIWGRGYSLDASSRERLAPSALAA